MAQALPSLTARHEPSARAPSRPVAPARAAEVAKPPLRLVPSTGPSPAAAPAVRLERPLAGVIALLISTALFPISDTFAKLLTAQLPAVEVAWLRYLVFLVIAAPLLLRGRDAVRTARPGLQVVRAMFAGVSTLLAILSFSFLPVAESTAIGFVAPVIVTALAALVLKERISARRWGAALLGFIGVMIIVQPGTAAFKPASLIPLVCSFCSASSIITTRMARDERIDTTLIYTAAIGFILLSGAVVFSWHGLTGPQIAVGALVGFFATVASLFQIYAYRFAPASLLVPFTYSQLLWASGLGYLTFGSLPGPAMWIGAAVIAGAGIVTAWSESRRR